MLSDEFKGNTNRDSPGAGIKRWREILNSFVRKKLADWNLRSQSHVNSCIRKLWNWNVLILTALTANNINDVSFTVDSLASHLLLKLGSFCRIEAFYDWCFRNVLFRRKPNFPILKSCPAVTSVSCRPFWLLALPLDYQFSFQVSCDILHSMLLLDIWTLESTLRNLRAILMK